MHLRPEQLAAHLAKGCRSLYTLQGDDPLLMQEAADAIRAAARANECAEREVFTVSGAHFDWSAVLGSAQSMSLFAQSKLIEIRVPSGKPGTAGSEALQRYCDALPDGVVTLVSLPRLDSSQLKSAWFLALESHGIHVRLDPVDRAALPAWIAQRLALQHQRVQEGEEGQRTLSFFADRVEGNLLAAHQEIQKIALLYPSGELSLEQVEAAVLNVARYDVRQWCEAVFAGRVERAARMLRGLQAEGESAVVLHWQLADDLRALRRVRMALDQGKPMPLALSEARVWGARQKSMERAVGLVSERQLRRLVSAASVCDGIVKGLRRPDWPTDPFEALHRLMLGVLSLTMAPSKQRSARGAPLALRA